jgi:hypothetical protein
MTDVAERLAAALGRARGDLKFRNLDTHEADGPAIARALEACAAQIQRETPNVTIGLNYTGGTKPMSAYSVLALRKVFPRAQLSYLHANTLSMVIDAGGPVQTVPVKRSVQLTLDNIVDLHGFRVATRSETPRHLDISRAIGRAHGSGKGAQEWRTWLNSWPKPDPQQQGPQEEPRLPEPADHPLLQPVIDAFSAACSGPATPAGVAAALRASTLRSCYHYFNGGWLEDLTLDGAQRARARIALDDCAAGLDIQPNNRDRFQIDVAATIGYQLFAISCIMTEQKPRAKEHLLEVVTRARQMGGDEARFALVCLSDNPQALEKEVSQAWDAAGKLKVFGRGQLPYLSDHLRDWFCTANQEVT